MGYALLFNTLIFVDMLPLVHWFFPYFTPLSALSILLSLLFVIFFPAMLIAHIVGLGALCDSFLQWAMNLNLHKKVVLYAPYLGVWIFYLYGNSIKVYVE